MDFMCQYANCESTDTPILVSAKVGGYRLRFCCWEHAGLYCLKYAKRTERPANNAFPKVPSAQCLLGKEYGVHAGYDNGGELVYIGLDNLKMHRHVIENIEMKWNQIFGEKNTNRA